MTDLASPNKLLTDIRELIAIVDRRLVQLRQHGPSDALRTMEDIRNRMVQLEQSLAGELGSLTN